MVRLEGISAAIRAAFRPWAIEPAAVVTAFGGASVLLFLLSIWYWVGDRRKGATVVSYAFVALATVLVLKAVLGVPRPPQSVHAVAISSDSHGFPSGHAVAAIVVFGGLVAVYERRDVWTVAAVSLLVAAVALSRVVLGVHYLGDVLAGLAVGGALVAVLYATVGEQPVVGFGLAAVVAAVAVVLGVAQSQLALGGALGGVAASFGIDRVPDPRSLVERAALVVVGVPVIVGVDELVEAAGSVPLAILGNAGLVAAILLLPVIVGLIPPTGLREAADSQSKTGRQSQP